MGNVATSCIVPSIISNYGVVKVIFFSNGNLQVYTKPVKAAEIMLANPGQFVCEFTSLEVGRRIHGLSADTILEKRQVYFILPMDLLYSVLTQEEMSFLTYQATKALKHYNFAKIFPVFSEFCMFLPSSESNRRIVEEARHQEFERLETVKRSYSKQRSWKPALHTIVEATP